MTTLHFSERDIEVAIRWSEVYAKECLAEVSRSDGHPIRYDLEYDFENQFTILIQLVPRCQHNGEWVRCNDMSCMSTTWMTRVLVYLEPYETDVFFSLTIPDESALKLLRPKFEALRGDHTMCICGRMGRQDHLLESERGKCNNCYIYGFVRGEICSICLLDDGKPWMKTACGHYFHDLCWSKVEHRDYIRKCPMCRTHNDRSSITKL